MTTLQSNNKRVIMSKIKVINKGTLKKFRIDFEKAVAAFSKKSGIVIKLGGIRFNDTSFTGKLEVILADTSSGMSAEEAMGRNSLDLEGEFLGLKADDYGRTWKSWDGQTYRLVGVKSSRPKYPVSGVNVLTGKGFKFGTDIIDKLSKVKK
jgi:hypothetical protein